MRHLQPSRLLEIQWVDGGQHCAYADRKIADSIRGQIVEIGSIDATVKTDGSSDSSQVRLTLEDTDGAIKAICGSHDLHKRPVWVYQWFEGLSLSDKFLLFKGEINSPFSWNEGDRTVMRNTHGAARGSVGTQTDPVRHSSIAGLHPDPANVQQQTSSFRL